MTEYFTDLKSLSSEAGEFLDENLEKLGISRTGQLSETVVDKLYKRDLAPIAHWALFYLGEYIAMTTDIDGVSSNMKSEMIALQKSVNKLQAELLTYKDNEVKELKSVVKSTVESSVKSEFQSYSSVLQKSLESSDSSINKEELKKVVQNVVQEEDRSRNLMIFGLPEENSEDLNATVSKIFTEIGERPRIDACRLGKKIPANSARPVKVTARSSTVVAQILSKAKQLKNVEAYRKVFLSPDRSSEQRLKQKQLVIELKRLSVEKPGQKHFISGGRINSVDKT